MAKLKIIDRVKTWAKMKKELRRANRMACEIGVFAAGNSFIAMIAEVHEYGATITPNGEFLTIPTPAAGGRSARDFGPELFRPKGKDVLAVSRGGGQIEVMFILKRSVTIPERSFIRSTFDKKKNDWSNFLNRQMDQIIAGNLTAEQAMDRLGMRMVADVQETMTKLRSPANAPITVANKGSSNPLIDDGRMRQAITYKVVRR